MSAPRRSGQSVVFALAGEWFAVEIAHVSEIIRVGPIAPVPRAAPHVRGILNLRGRTIPVLDLRRRLSLEAAPDGERTRIVVVEGAHGHAGLLVDAVAEVASFDLATGGDADQAGVILGLAHGVDRTVAVLDLEKVLAA